MMNSNRRKLVSALGLAIGMTALAALPQAGLAQQAYPNKPVRLIVPYPPGGSADVLARLIGNRLSDMWQQQAVIDNRPGANGILATELAAKAAPDGYTLFLVTDSQVSINPSMYASLPYDWKRDFVPISLVATMTQVLLVPTSLPVNTVQELVALARAKPGHLNYASIGIGSTPHLLAELFKTTTGVNIVHVPYKGAPQTMLSLLAGEAQVLFTSESTAAPHIKAGKVRAIASVGRKRTAASPDVPTLMESGLAEDFTMDKTIWGRWILAVALAFALPVHAQEYPVKPIKIVVPNPPGGGTDTWARLIADKLRLKWGQPVTVENRPGAGGNVGADVVAKATPDGYTVLVTHPSPLVVNKSLFAKLAFEPEAFVPVSLIVASPDVLLVHPQVPTKTIQELIAYARANPDKLNYASQGNGSTAHLGAELFKSAAGVKMVHVPFAGTAPALTALLAGQVDLIFLDIGLSLPYIRTGKLRALAVGSKQRNSFLPGVPAVAETLPGHNSGTWTGMVAPPGTPTDIAHKLSAAIAEALKQPDIAKRLVDLSIEAVGSTPEQMKVFLREETERWGNVIRSSGAKVD